MAEPTDAGPQYEQLPNIMDQGGLDSGVGPFSWAQIFTTVGTGMGGMMLGQMLLPGASLGLLLLGTALGIVGTWPIEGRPLGRLGWDLAAYQLRRAGLGTTRVRVSALYPHAPPPTRAVGWADASGHPLLDYSAPPATSTEY